MNTELHRVDPASRAREREAWGLFWADSAQSRCAAGAHDVWPALAEHWSAFARSLARGTRVLDLGCGGGVVARLLLDARPDLRVTGIDAAQVPAADRPNLELRSDTPMESLPFANGSFGAVVSQFGFEYGNTAATARELARVLTQHARLSLLVHHADSPVVAAGRARLGAIVTLLGPALRAAFCSGNTAVFDAEICALLAGYPHDELIAEIARALPARLGFPKAMRIDVWSALEQALAPELCVAESLQACCVAPKRVDEWLVPLYGACRVMAVGVIQDSAMKPVAWRIEGAARPDRSIPEHGAQAASAS